jgi:hypothetical protein
MRYIKVFEHYIKSEDIIKCIENGGTIETNIVKGLFDNPTEVRPISIDGDEVTVEIDNKTYDVSINDIKKINL